MKLLLTSGGIENDSMVRALRNLVGKDFTKANLVFIPTAANVEAGDKWWLINDLVKCKELGFNEVDIVDIAAVAKHVWEPRLQNADVLMFGGGNTSYLMEQLRKTGLAQELPNLLKIRVYVGVSAGSMITSPNLKEKEMQQLYDEQVFDIESDEGLGLVNFLVVPHLNSPFFPHIKEYIDEVAKGIDLPIYALDDQSAVQVIDNDVEVISEGEWKRFH